MIDWTKPIETVPCERNPTPIKCTVDELANRYGGLVTVRVRLGSDWSHPDISEKLRNTAVWEFHLDGRVGNDFLPDLRNVEPLEPGNTITMELNRDMHRALVEAGYAPLDEYVKRWGTDAK